MLSHYLISEHNYNIIFCSIDLSRKPPKFLPKDQRAVIAAKLLLLFILNEFAFMSSVMIWYTYFLIYFLTFLWKHLHDKWIKYIGFEMCFCFCCGGITIIYKKYVCLAYERLDIDKNDSQKKKKISSTSSKLTKLNWLFSVQANVKLGL